MAIDFPPTTTATQESVTEGASVIVNEEGREMRFLIGDTQMEFWVAHQILMLSSPYFEGILQKQEEEEEKELEIEEADGRVEIPCENIQRRMDLESGMDSNSEFKPQPMTFVYNETPSLSTVTFKDIKPEEFDIFLKVGHLNFVGCFSN